MITCPEPQVVFEKAIQEHIEVVRQVLEQQPTLERIARALATAIANGQKILFCGNGGSAADSQHLAAEFVGRYRRERRGLPAVALTTDSSVLTSVANDYGYEAVFSRQVEALGNPGDVLVGISTSGNSPSVLAALQTATSQGLLTVGFTGASGGNMAQIVNHLFAVASRDTARIQETHILAGHMLCDWVELDCVCRAKPADAGADFAAGGVR